MAILNLEYYTQKDLYSDGDIEEQMLKMAKEGITCEDLSSEQVSFPVIYHFSDLRANILNWYPITKSDSVLEIGADAVRSPVRSVKRQVRSHLWNSQKEEHRSIITATRRKKI